MANAGPPYVLDEAWYTLAEAQERVGIPGTRGKRLRTLLRRIERKKGVALIRETRLPSGKIRREVGEWTLWGLFPKNFETEMSELNRVLVEVRAANDPRSRVLRKVHGYIRSRIDSLLDPETEVAGSTRRPSRPKTVRAPTRTAAPPSAERTPTEGERRDFAEEAMKEREPPSEDRSR